MRFFLDNCLSPRYAKSLNALSERDGHEVVHLVDKFPRDSTDPRWIKELGAEGDWVIVSGDTRIIKSKELRREWQAARLTAFSWPLVVPERSTRSGRGGLRTGWERGRLQEVSRRGAISFESSRRR